MNFCTFPAFFEWLKCTSFQIMCVVFRLTITKKLIERCRRHYCQCQKLNSAWSTCEWICFPFTTYSVSFSIEWTRDKPKFCYHNYFFSFSFINKYLIFTGIQSNSWWNFNFLHFYVDFISIISHLFPTNKENVSPENS